jgi:hypothetical protein
MSDFLDFSSEEQTKPKYLKQRGIYHIAVESYKWSQEIEGYNKTPFVRFNIKDKVSGGIASITFWFSTPNDSEKKAAIKKKVLRQFLTDLGCNLKNPNPKDLLDCTIGKECKVALREKERVIYGKTDGKPMVVTDLDFYYSGSADKPLQANDSKMVFPLSASMRAKFEQELAEWNKANGGQYNNAQSAANAVADAFGTSNTDEEEDWPF